MSRRIVSLTVDTLSDLPVSCRGCAFWELSPSAHDRARDDDSRRAAKQAWLSATLLEWGSCGQLIYVDGSPAAYLLYAPPAYVPRAISFATSPPSPNSLLLMTGRVLPDYAGQGLGRMLVHIAAREAVGRGIRALEAFGRAQGTREVPTSVVSTGCLLPEDYLRAVGFETIRPHPHTPRMRLDVRSAVTWRADVEHAIERLLGTLQSPIPSR